MRWLVLLLLTGCSGPSWLDSYDSERQIFRQANGFALLEGKTYPSEKIDKYRRMGKIQGGM